MLLTIFRKYVSNAITKINTTAIKYYMFMSKKYLMISLDVQFTTKNKYMMLIPRFFSCTMWLLFTSYVHRLKSITEENVTNVRKTNRRVTCRQIKEILGLNAPLIRSLLKNHLHVAKLCCLWVQHNLTKNQKIRYVK